MSNLAFSDHFKKEDKQKALMYRKDWGNNLDLAIEYHNKGDFDKAEMHLAHAMRLLGEIRILNIQHKNHEKMVQEQAMWGTMRT